MAKSCNKFFSYILSQNLMLFLIKNSKIMIYQIVVLILVIFSCYKVWTIKKLNLKEYTTSNHNLKLQMTSSTKVMNTRVVRLMKTNNCYFGHLPIWQSESKVVHKIYNLSYSSMNYKWDMSFSWTNLQPLCRMNKLPKQKVCIFMRCAIFVFITF